MKFSLHAGKEALPGVEVAVSRLWCVDGGEQRISCTEQHFDEGAAQRPRRRYEGALV
jgi:hypothetical protein